MDMKGVARSSGRNDGLDGYIEEGRRIDRRIGERCSKCGRGRDQGGSEGPVRRRKVDRGPFTGLMMCGDSGELAGGFGMAGEDKEGM